MLPPQCVFLVLWGAASPRIQAAVVARRLAYGRPAGVLVIEALQGKEITWALPVCYFR